MLPASLIFIQMHKCVSFDSVSMSQLQIIKIYPFRNVYQITHHRSLHFLVYFIELQCICHVDSSLPTMAGAGLRSLKVSRLEGALPGTPQGHQAEVLVTGIFYPERSKGSPEKPKTPDLFFFFSRNLESR